MRYSSAVVLSALAVGQAAAANLHNRHASFHERRQAEAKRDLDNVDWDKVAYDLKSVDWSAVNWSSVFASSTAAAGPAPTHAAAAQYAPSPEAKPSSSAPAVQAAAVTSASPAQPSATAAQSSGGASYGSAVSDLLSGVDACASRVGALVGKNDKSNNGGIWVGTDSAWQAEFVNQASSDLVLWCWKADGFSGMEVKQTQPEISVGIKAGQSINLSWAADVPSACAQSFADTNLAEFGGWDQTWFEVTFGSSGAFDISRNVNMNGNSISSKGSKCTSDMDTCVFKCTDSSAASCETGYNLFNCNASNGGGGGYDAVMQGTGGGCAMGASSEKITVTFS